MKGEKIFAALDLGANRFVAAVGTFNTKGTLIVRALEDLPARGVEQGVLSDPIECSDAVARLIRQVEKILPMKLTRALAVLHGNHLKSYNANASIPIPDPTVGVSRRDVERALTTCRTLSLDYNRRILHSFERGFSVDGQSGIKDPVGLYGTKLTVELHLVTALTLASQNLIKVLNRAGLEVEELVLPGLAAGEAVLSDLDRDVGVTFIRIGDLQTETLFYSEGKIRETFLLPWGTDQLIEGLSRSFKLPRLGAERIFSQLRTLEEKPERSAIPLRVQIGALTRSFPQGDVQRYVTAKAKEFLTRLRRHLDESVSFRESAAGIVMVGGLSDQEGFLEMAEGILNMPVRLGTARELQVDPHVKVGFFHTAAIGLLRYGAKRANSFTSQTGRPSTPLGRWVEGARRLLEEYF